jgi:hypothetical protein
VLWKPYQLARIVVVVEVNGYTIEPGAKPSMRSSTENY